MKPEQMDYKRELKKLQKRRRAYYPAVTRLMDLYHAPGSSVLPVELIHDRDALTILELIDVGYLDGDVLVIKRRFDDIVGLLYIGGYPLTESGEKFLRREGRTLKGRIRTLLDGFRKRR
jgi:hypothetical protein